MTSRVSRRTSYATPVAGRFQPDSPQVLTELCIGAVADPSLRLEDYADVLRRALVEDRSAGSVVRIDRLAVDGRNLAQFSDLPGSWEFGDLGTDYGAQPSISVVDRQLVQLKIRPGLRVGEPVIVSFPATGDAEAFPIVVSAITGPAVSYLFLSRAGT